MSKTTKKSDPSPETEGSRTDEADVVKAVLQMAQSCDYEEEHSQQVARLALKLFDEMAPWHALTARHRLLLKSAGILHDIGWIKGRTRHHKTARDMIIACPDLPLALDEKIKVALAARYHRRSLPQDTHKYYADLLPADKQCVKTLAAFLRLADGLDRRHASAVKDLRCELQSDRVVIHVAAEEFAEWEEAVARKKADLFQDVFKKDIVIAWQASPPA